MNNRFILRRSLAATAFTALLMGGVGALHAQGPVWLSGPSVIALGAKASFSAGHLPPGSVVRLRVQEANTASHQSDVLVAADGTLSYELNPSLEGQHSLSILDASGRELATTRLNVMR